MKRNTAICAAREVLPVPGGYSIRGENIFQHLATNLEVYVLCPDYGSSTFYEKRCFERGKVRYYINKVPGVIAGHRFWAIPGSGIVLRRFKRAHFYWFLDRYVKKIEPDVIIGHTPVDVALPAALVAEKHKKPFIFDIRQFQFIEMGNTLRGKYEERLTRNVIEKSSGFAVIGGGARKTLESLLKSGDKRPIANVPNGINMPSAKKRETGFVRDLRQYYKLKKFVIGYIGTISDYEGLDFLLDAFLENGFGDASLLIVGDGPFFCELKNMVGARECNDVVLTGRVGYEDVCAFYELIDLFVLPRKSTPITETVTPIKAFEVMQARKPLLCSSVGGFREIIVDGENGFVFRAGDKKHLKERLRFLTGEGEILDRVSKTAYERVVSSFKWENTVKDYKILIENVIEQWPVRCVTAGR